MSSNYRNDDHGFGSNRSHWQNTSSYDKNSKILLVIIVTFSTIILMVFAYHLYARFVFRPRRLVFQDLSVAISQPPKRGLDSLAIASLPTFILGVNGDLVAMECPVCLSLLEEKDMVRMLPDCKHLFHVSCVDKWLTTCSTCPVCRTDVEPKPRLEPEPREGPVDRSLEADGKIGGSSVIRLDSFKRVFTRDQQLFSCLDQDHVLDLERQ